MPEMETESAPRRGRPPRVRLSPEELATQGPVATEPDLSRETFFNEDEEVVITAQPKQAPRGSYSVDGRVVYLGSNPVKTVVLPGVDLQESVAPPPSGLTKSEHREWREDNNHKVFKPGGEKEFNTAYVFNRLDDQGQEITERMTPSGKVWCRCRNIAHYAWFMHAKDAEGGPQFEVRVSPDVRLRIEQYMRRRAEEVVSNDDDPRSVLKAMGFAAQGRR